MKFIALTSALFASTVVGWVDLGPAYRISMKGSEEWTLLNKYTKTPVFVEGLEMLDDNTLLESAGGYYGSKIQKLSYDHSKL